jgi:hypothetical protein
VRRLSSSIEIAAPSDRIWPYVAEFEWWPRWGVSISDVESEANRVAPGVTGKVRTRLGLWLPFTIEDVVPGSFWDWSVAGVRATEHHLEPQRDHARVRFTAPLVVAPYAAVMTASLKKLKRLVEVP